MCNKQHVKYLEKLLKEYEEAKKFFDDAKTRSGKSEVSPLEIRESIQILYKLKHNGKKIEEFYECQSKARSKEHMNTEYRHKSILNKTAKKQSKKSKDSDKEKPKSQNRGKNFCLSLL